MSQLAPGIGVQDFRRFSFGGERFNFQSAGQNFGRTPASSPASELARIDRALPRAASAEPGARARRKLAYSLRPMKVADVVRAMKIVMDNFRGEVGLVARSYLWHFGRRAGLAGVGAMWARRGVEVAADDGRSVSLDLLSSFVHDRDVAWIDLGGRSAGVVDLAIEAFRQWPRRHRLLVVRVDRARAARLLDAGFGHAGHIPDADAEHVYLYATPSHLARDGGPRLRLRFGRRRRLESECEFSVVERDASVVGLTGIYQTGFWRDVIWGAWGAVDRASARRDAVFEILRLTEERARTCGARWFCLETSDSERYRHARRIYELHGLQLLLTVPGFYRSSDGGSEALLVYGKPVLDGPGRLPISLTEQETRLAA